MRRHPARDPDADRRDLARPSRAGRRQPDARQPLDRGRLEIERGEGLDDRLLEIPDVPLHVLAVAVEIEDRIADELSGSVVGRLSAAVRLDELDVGPVRDVELLRLVGAPADRDRRAGARPARSVSGISRSATAARERALQLEPSPVGERGRRRERAGLLTSRRPSPPAPSPRAARAGRGGSRRCRRRRRAGGRR